MKILLISLSLAISLAGCAQGGTPATISAKTNINTVPTELITEDSTFWTISTLSTIGYVNTNPGSNYNTYRSGGGMLVQFKFKNNNHFEFRLYVEANSYGTSSDAWTQVEGTVEFTKDAKGQSIFITHAEKGIYRTNRNGIANSRPIPENDLKGQHSSTFLWEKTTFTDDPRNVYLLMVDLEQHPDADVSNPKTIDPSWVSKFHIPSKS